MVFDFEVKLRSREELRKRILRLKREKESSA